MYFCQFSIFGFRLEGELEKITKSIVEMIKFFLITAWCLGCLPFAFYNELENSNDLKFLRIGGKIRVKADN